MKTTITLLMPLIAIIAAIFSFKTFFDADYYVSALLTIVAFLSSSFEVYLLSNKKKAMAHH